MNVRLAHADEAPVVAAVLSAAAAHLRARGSELWPVGEVSVSAVAPHVEAGLYHLGFENSQAIGVFRLQSDDPDFWPEFQDGRSVYLHKLAVLPAMRGRGLAHELLRHAVGIARERGASFLRLDCMTDRAALRKLYEEFGFSHHSQKVLGGVSFERFEFDVRGTDA